MIAVIGGGPAGMMAAMTAGRLGQSVMLIEKNASLGKKLMLSGNGRCNITNACPAGDLPSHFLSNGEFLRNAFASLSNKDVIEFFTKRGLCLKVEEGLRVFPATDRAKSVLDVLTKELARDNIKVLYGTQAKNVSAHNGTVHAVMLIGKKAVYPDAVIMATGGASYSYTGSDGKGIEMARALGHEVVSLRPGLVPVVVDKKDISALEGLSLRGIRVSFYIKEKRSCSARGDIVFTAKGLSGPPILSRSGFVADALQSGRDVSLEIDLLPGIAQGQTKRFLIELLAKNSNRKIASVLGGIMPYRMSEYIVSILSIDPATRANQVTAGARHAIGNAVRALRFGIKATEPLQNAMVTKGGVSTKEIDPRTMASKRVRGLYFAGEMIDIDGDTGGFNMQAALSTGYLAGESAAKEARGRY